VRVLRATSPAKPLKEPPRLLQFWFPDEGMLEEATPAEAKFAWGSGSTPWTAAEATGSAL